MFWTVLLYNKSSKQEESFCNEFLNYLATLNIAESVNEGYQEPTDCFLNGVAKSYDSSFPSQNSLELNFTCVLYLHTTYNGSLILISEDEAGESPLESKEDESQLTFSELNLNKIL